MRWHRSRCPPPGARHPLPAADGEVVLRVLATTATYTDLLVLRGNYMPRFPPPVTPGYDGCAVVHAVGQGVSGLKVGDAVITMPQHGCFSTHVVLPEKLCVPVELPAGVSPEEAACVALTGITAYQQLHRHAKKQIEKPDASVLVHSAAGGTGAMLVEVAKAAGVKTIFGTCGAHNLDTVRAHGATAFDYNTDWDAQLREASGGAGVDVVHDALVLGGNLEKGLRLLKPGGVYIAYGFTNMGKPGMFDFMSAATALTRISLQHFVFSWFDKKARRLEPVTSASGLPPSA